MKDTFLRCGKVFFCLLVLACTRRYDKIEALDCIPDCVKKIMGKETVP